MKKILLSLIMVLCMSPNVFAVNAVGVGIGTGGDAVVSGVDNSSTSNNANINVNTPTAKAVGIAENINGGKAVSKQSQKQSQSNKQSIVQNFEASKIPPPLISTIAQTNNPELYDLRTGTTAQTANLSFLLWQSWSPDHRELVEGCSDRTKLIVVTDKKIEQYKSDNGENSFVLLNENVLAPEGLGSITIYPIVGKGTDVDGSTLRSDIKAYVNHHYSGLKVYFKKSWAASMYGVKTKGRAAQIAPSATLWPGGDIISGLAGALGGNNGTSEPLPTISLTAILSDK